MADSFYGYIWPKLLLEESFDVLARRSLEADRQHEEEWRSIRERELQARTERWQMQLDAVLSCSLPLDLHTLEWILALIDALEYNSWDEEVMSDTKKLVKERIQNIRGVVP